MPPADEVNVPELTTGEEPIDQKLLDAIISPPEKGKKPAAPAQNKASPQAPAQVAAEPPNESLEVMPDDLPDDVQLEPEGPAVLDDNTPLEVTVDGKPVTVTLKQLRDSYSGEAAIEARLQQSAEARNHFVTQASQLYQANQVVMQRLQQLDNHLQQFAEPNIPPEQWEWLRQNNPQQYLIMRDNQQRAREQREALQREAAETQQKQEYINSQAKQQYIDSEAQKLFAKLPDMADPNKRETLMGNIMEALTHYGYTPQELKDVTDHRVFVALADAAKYRALLKSKGSNGASSSGSVTQNVGRRVPGRTDGQKAAEITKRARDTGRPDDVAMTLIMANRPRQTLRG